MIDGVSAEGETVFDALSDDLREASRPKASRKRRKATPIDEVGVSPAKRAYNRVIELCKMGVVRELKENGISAHDIEGWPEAYEERFGDELERALSVLEKNPPRSKNPRASAYGKLMRKGYDASVSAQASGIWFARQCENCDK